MFLYRALPTDENMSESQVRDADDRPILRAAITAKADVLLTGDKDFEGEEKVYI